MPFSNYVAEQIIAWMKGASFAVPPSGRFLSLHTADPTGTGTVADVTAQVTGSAERPALPPGVLLAPVRLPGTGLEISNGTELLVCAEAANVSPLLISHVALWSAASGGNSLMQDALAAPTWVGLGDRVQFDPLTLSLRAI